MGHFRDGCTLWPEIFLSFIPFSLLFKSLFVLGMAVHDTCVEVGDQPQVSSHTVPNVLRWVFLFVAVYTELVGSPASADSFSASDLAIEETGQCLAFHGFQGCKHGYLTSVWPAVYALSLLSSPRFDCHQF